jgi:lipoprotein-anchoring transpeptidase ErfK/SrfK
MRVLGVIALVLTLSASAIPAIPATAATEPQANVVAPSQAETVGVGMPIILRFDRPVQDRAQVQRSLTVHTSLPVTGAWHWFGDGEAVYRPQHYWPPYTQVHLTGDGLDLTFQIGDSHITVANSRTHYQVVSFDGHVVRRIPVSMGKATQPLYTTHSGIHLTMGKNYYVVMDSATVGCPPGCPDYYRHGVFHAVRISGSGEYEHSAPWAVGDLGRHNISHGCINMAPADAAWFYAHAQRGDVVQVIGGGRPLAPENGWGYWQLSWANWLRGSAVKPQPQPRSLTTPTAKPSFATSPVPTTTPSFS